MAQASDSIVYERLSFYVDYNILWYPELVLGYPELNDRFVKTGNSFSAGMHWKYKIAPKHAIGIRHGLDYRHYSSRQYFSTVVSGPAFRDTTFYGNIDFHQKQLSLDLGFSYYYQPFLKVPLQLGFGTGMLLKLFHHSHGKGILESRLVFNNTSGGKRLLNKDFNTEWINPMPLTLSLSWNSKQSTFTLGVSAIFWDVESISGPNASLYKIGYSRDIYSLSKPVKFKGPFRSKNPKLKIRYKSL